MPSTSRSAASRSTSPRWCSEVAEANQPLAVNKQQTITVSAPPNIVTMCDTDRIREAIDNLVSNAIKYSPIGGKIAVAVDP